MNDDAIWARLTDVFRETFGDDDLVLKTEMIAEDIEEWDSLTNVQLIVAIEQAFDGLKFNLGEIANLKNVGELFNVIKNRSD